MALRPTVSRRVPCFRAASALDVKTPGFPPFPRGHGNQARNESTLDADSVHFGNPASSVSPVALRPRLTTGLPFSVVFCLQAVSRYVDSACCTGQLIIGGVVCIGAFVPLAAGPPSCSLDLREARPRAQRI